MPCESIILYAEFELSLRLGAKATSLELKISKLSK
jgi:hypothetical protein